jgi:sulfite exporter TauE/SafE
MLDLWLVLATGLLTGFHCIGMCGPFVVGYTLGHGPTSRVVGIDSSRFSRTLRSLYPHILFNGGRAVTYVAIGATMGFLGSFVQLGGFQGLAAVLAGIIMIVLGFNLLGIFSRLNLFSALAGGTGKLLIKPLERVRASQSPLRTFPLGLLIGFLPCGPLYAMDFYAASTGSVLGGGLTMFLFWLGTVPALLGLGIFSVMISGRVRGMLLRIAACVVILLGTLTLIGGLSVMGLPLPNFYF